ncbi:unnamed protein product [Tilletia controversa]|nr:unnamed protein product [Tilletia controversa]
MQVFAHTFLLLATSLLFLGALAEATTSSPGEQRRHHHRHHHHGHHGHKHHPVDQGTAPPATNVPPKDALTAAGGGTPTPANGVPPPVPVTAPAPIGDKPEDKCELSGGMATQYWDCCKIAAAWPGNPNVDRPAYSCAKDGETVLEDTNVRSGCGGGTAYACNRHQPFVSPTNPMLSYAIGARPHELGIHSFYGACYSIKFKELPGKTLVFQALNTGDYPKLSQIDIQVPGGGVGGLNACPTQWHSPPDGWGRRFGGIYHRNECDQLPVLLRRGCLWRYDWLAPEGHPDGMNPTIASMCRVQCPKILTDLTGTIRKDEAKYALPPK